MAVWAMIALRKADFRHKQPEKPAKPCPPDIGGRMRERTLHHPILSYFVNLGGNDMRTSSFASLMGRRR
jgi:hypothetical protein